MRPASSSFRTGPTSVIAFWKETRRGPHRRRRRRPRGGSAGSTAAGARRRRVRVVRCLVALLRQGRPGAHGEGEGLILLDEIDERRDPELADGGLGDCAVHQVVAMNVSEGLTGRGRDPSRRVHQSPPRRRSHGAPEISRAPPPVGRQGRTRVHRDHPDSQTLLGELQGEVELGDVSAEEMNQVDGGDEEVDALRLVVETSELKRGNLLLDVLDDPGSPGTSGWTGSLVGRRGGCRLAWRARAAWSTPSTTVPWPRRTPRPPCRSVRGCRGRSRARVAMAVSGRAGPGERSAATPGAGEHRAPTCS